MSSKTATLAYAAGIFDGEGHVIIHVLRRKDRNIKLYHEVELAITNTNLEMLLWFKSEFDGTVTAEHPGRGHFGSKPIWYWKLTSAKATQFLKAILPYLIIKKLQAELAIEFQNRCIGKYGRNLTPEGIALREQYRQKMKELNHPKEI